MSSLSQAQICNLALYHLGCNQIGDISDSVPEAQACQMYWIPCRDDVFAEHKWAFANSQVPLVLSADTSVQGWLYEYAYPSDVGAVWTVFNPANFKRREEIEFDKLYVDGVGNVIVSNEPLAICEATYIVTDPKIWDAKFVLAFSRRLAAEMAQSLTGDAAVAQAQLILYTALIGEAKRIGFNQQNKKPHQVHGYRDARGGVGFEHKSAVTLDQAVLEV